MSDYIVGTIDAAQVALYVFWAFFAGLVVYLVRENTREGYPKVSELTGKPFSPGTIFGDAGPKTFLRHDGTKRVVPDQLEEYDLKAVPTTGFTGSPLTPTGDPLVDGVGPAAWCMRPDEPDVRHDGQPRIIPLSATNELWLYPGDPDPRGMKVACFDGGSPGTVVDVWVDSAEHLMRYLEVETSAGRKLLPVNMCRIVGQDGEVKVRSVTADQFLRVPSIKGGGTITLREEDMVQAYFSGGTLYAIPGRTEPLL